MSYNLTTKRFVDCVNHLKEVNLIKSYRQFAISLDFHPQSLNEILKEKRNVTLDLLTKACDKYKFSPTYLHTGEGSMFLTENNHLNDLVQYPDECEIIHISSDDQSNYCEKPQDKELLDKLNRFSLPGFKTRQEPLRCFDIKDDSMEPSLYHGDRIVCTKLDQEDWIKGIVDNFVYVIVTESNIYIRRVGNLIKNEGKIELSSDNKFFDSFSLSIHEIKEVWRVSTKISPFMASPSNQRNAFNLDIDSMKSTIDQQNEVIKTLNSTLEKFLKQNRAR